MAVGDRRTGELFGIDAEGYPKFDADNPPWGTPQPLTYERFRAAWEEYVRRWLPSEVAAADTSDEVARARPHNVTLRGERK